MHSNHDYIAPCIRDSRSHMYPMYTACDSSYVQCHIVAQDMVIINLCAKHNPTYTTPTIITTRPTCRLTHTVSGRPNDAPNMYVILRGAI